MGEEKFRRALTRLLGLGTPESILILMYNYKQYADAQFSVYLGFTFENVQAWPQDVFLQAFLDNLPPALYPLMDGRLYEGQERLPLHVASPGDTSLGKE